MANPLDISNSEQDAATEDFRVSFSKAIASGVDQDYFGIIPAIGPGMTVSQANGLLSIATGTTVNSETVIRSNRSFGGDIVFRYGLSLSQRIANQAFFVELVDVIGDNLTANITSATTVVVTVPGHPFTQESIGQSVYVANYTGTGTFVSGRYPIAAVSGNDITFTVAGFAVGTGTVSLFGYNYHHVVYDGTSATSAKYDAQRRGYASGDTTTSITSTAGTGHSGIISMINSVAQFADHGASGGTLTLRADRTANLPVDADKLYIQIRAVNGAVAPATTTTMSINHISLITAESPVVTIAGTLPQSQNAPLPVSMISGTVSSISSSIVPGVAATNLGKAEDAVAATGDTGIATLGVRVPATPAAQTSAAGDYGAMAVSSEGKLVVSQGAADELGWQTNPVTLTTTTSTALKAAAAAGVRNYLTDITIANTSATAVRVDILDGTTVIRSYNVGAGATISQDFVMALKGTAATAMNVQLSTAVTDVRVSANGYLGV